MPDLRELLSYSRDFGQGMSNATAANVSVPIDMLALGLQRLGVPMNYPVLGSEWLRKHGLTAEPQNPLAGALGEHAGMFVPMMAATRMQQNKLLPLLQGR